MPIPAGSLSIIQRIGPAAPPLYGNAHHQPHYGGYHNYGQNNQPWQDLFYTTHVRVIVNTHLEYDLEEEWSPLEKANYLVDLSIIERGPVLTVPELKINITD